MAICKYCGKDFTKNHNRQVYCSETCRSFARKEQNRINRKNFINKNRTSKKCFWCGRVFTPQHNNEVYCSESCKKYAKQEQDRINQHKFYHTWKNTMHLLSTRIGTGTLSSHAKTNFQQEYAAINKELQRLRIR